METKTKPLAPRIVTWFGEAERRHLQASPLVPRKKRASKPKVRTGCITCKRRRIKCDEGKPTCHQCQRARIACDGYSKPQPPGFLEQPKPKPVQSRPRISAGRMLFPRPCIRANPGSTCFSQEDIPYFDFFCHQLTSELVGFSYSDFWSRIVLCDVMTDECVRGVVLAIGALSRAISREAPIHKDISAGKRPSALVPWTAENVMSEDHGIALNYYVKSLSTFRKHLNSDADKSSQRSLLVMSLLFITFELLQCNMKAVDSLMASAVELLKGSLKLYRRDRLPDPDSPPTPLDDDMEDMGHTLSFLSIMGSYTPFLKSQQAINGVWDVSLTDDVPDLRALSPRQIQTQWGYFWARATGFTGRSYLDHIMNRPYDKVARDRDQKAFLPQLERWRAVIDLGLVRARTANDERAKRALQMMQLLRLGMCICIHSCLDGTDMTWDKYDDEFIMLFESCLAFALESRPRYSALFTMNVGVLSTLGPIMTKCRNHNLRMRAFELMKRMPWREGTWDCQAEIFAQLGSVVLEERGRDANGFIGPEHRYTWIGGEWDLEKRTLSGRYKRGILDEDGNPVFATLELDLENWPDICAETPCTVDHGAEFRQMCPRYTQPRPGLLSGLTRTPQQAT